MLKLECLFICCQLQFLIFLSIIIWRIFWLHSRSDVLLALPWLQVVLCFLEEDFLVTIWDAGLEERFVQFLLAACSLCLWGFLIFPMWYPLLRSKVSKFYPCWGSRSVVGRMGQSDWPLAITLAGHRAICLKCFCHIPEFSTLFGSPAFGMRVMELSHSKRNRGSFTPFTQTATRGVGLRDRSQVNTTTL